MTRQSDAVQGAFPVARTGGSLTVEEHALIRRALGSAGGQRGPGIRPGLAALLEPAPLTLRAHGYQQRPVMCGVQKALLHGADRLGTAPQAWSDAEWHQVIQLFGGVFKLALTVVAVRGYGVRLGRGDGLLYRDVHGVQLARRLFGRAAFSEQCRRLAGALASVGYLPSVRYRHFALCVAELLLWHESAALDAVTEETWDACPFGASALQTRHRVGIALGQLGILHPGKPIRRNRSEPLNAEGQGLPAEWLAMCERWRATSPSARASRARNFVGATLAGRWAAQRHPEVRSPADWTADLAFEYVRYVMGRRVGDDTARPCRRTRFTGQPLAPRSKRNFISSIRLFFHDIQDWDWIPRRFNPARAFETPRDLKRVRPNPRPIDEEYWSKLRAAALSLAPKDLPHAGQPGGPAYPFEMTRAMAVVWAFSGCRSNEIARLELNCTYVESVPEQRDPVTAVVLPAFEQTMLRVPVGKTCGEFVKPVEAPLAEAVEAWRRARPQQAPLPDAITGCPTDHLFCIRGQRVSKYYLNASVIPLLLQKAGLPRDDTRGRITSHRGRATLATMLYNSTSGFTSLEAMRWLGHATLASGQHYVELVPTRLMTAFHRSTKLTEELRCVRVLVDGRPGPDDPVLRYDLGHGWCTNPAYAACAHRMACARCSFYETTEAFAPLLTQQAGRFVEMLQRLDLTDSERAAVEGDAGAVQVLLARLAGQPTPDSEKDEHKAASMGNQVSYLSWCSDR